MKVLIDTSVWSMALRKTKVTESEKNIVDELKELVLDLRVLMIGPIRQEILTGISDEEKYEQLRDKISAFHDEILVTEDFELAAKFSNECRRKGIQGSHTDFLICAVAVRSESAIFTVDKDFAMYKKHIPIQLYRINN